MTDLRPVPSAPSDAELISRVRGGDGEAYGQLFDRHRGAAYRMARQLSRGPDADDLVSEAFTKVFAVLKKGGGPDLAFRAYLLTSVRRLHTDRVRSASRVQPTDDLEPLHPGVPFGDPAVDEFERSAAARAFASLPERWQVVLWHLEVEGQKPAEVGLLLGMSANSVSALAYRAREGLRQAYLRMHLADTAGESCRWTTEHLGPYVRSALSRRDTARVQEHLRQCPRCTALYAELTEVNDNLRGVIAPVILGAAAVAYLKGGATVAGGALAPLFGKVGSFMSVPANAVAAGGIAATSAAVVAVAAVTMGGAPAGTQALADVPTGQVAVPTGDGGFGGPGGGPAGGSGVDGPARLGGPAGVGGVPGVMGGAAEGPDEVLIAGVPTTTATDGQTPSGPGGVLPSPSDPTTGVGGTPNVPGPTPTPTTSTATSTTPTATPTPTTPTATETPTTPTATETPTTPTTPPVPVGVDLGIDLKAAGLLVTARVDAPETPTGGAVLTVSATGAAVTLDPVNGVWTCDGAGTASITCSASNPLVAVLPITVVTTGTATVSATVGSPDNEDPNPDNDYAEVTVP